jgi:hypothetical protein
MSVSIISAPSPTGTFDKSFIPNPIMPPSGLYGTYVFSGCLYLVLGGEFAVFCFGSPKWIGEVEVKTGRLFLWVGGEVGRLEAGKEEDVDVV